MRTPKKKSAESFVKDIRNNTRRIFTAEQKILIVMEALRAETSKAELCRKHSVNQSQFYKWNKEFLEAGKKRLFGDLTREATSDEVAELKKENDRLKEKVADLVLRYDIVKKKVWIRSISTAIQTLYEINSYWEIRDNSTGNTK